MDDKPKMAFGEGFLKGLYETSSRRSVLTRIGRGVLRLVGISLLPVLPIDRIVPPSLAADPNCEISELCGIYGRLCWGDSCPNCGGGNARCPSCTSIGSFWVYCCPFGSGQTQYKYSDCCTNDVNCYNNCKTCKQCLNNSKRPDAWCDGYTYYACTIWTTNGLCT